MSPTDWLGVFRDYYGPTMNAFAAADADGRADELFAELDALFREQNQSADSSTTGSRRRSCGSPSTCDPVDGSGRAPTGADLDPIGLTRGVGLSAR